jgi:hypothetical protein
MLSLPSTLLISLFLTLPISASPIAADDGMWHPSGVQAGTTATTALAVATGKPYTQMTVTAAAGETTTAATHAMTTAAVAVTKASSVAAAGGDWQASVTWPAGCEAWANPCPAGAHISGGGIAGGAGATGSSAYENGFTSYTTMTDANGVITGMPPKATVAAGVSTMSTAIKASNSSAAATTVAAMSSKTSSGTFSFATTKAAQSNGAAEMKVFGSFTLIAAVGTLFALL